MPILRSLKGRLLVLILPLCLLPLLGISAYSYYLAKGRITADRVALYLEEIAKGVADTIYITILEKQENANAMILFSEFSEALTGGAKEQALERLNGLVLAHEVYDLIVLFDVEGHIVLTSSQDRRFRDQQVTLPADKLESLIGVQLRDYTPGDWLYKVRSGRSGFVDWHYSKLVQELYDYSSDDIALQYNIGFATPVFDQRQVVVGGVLSFMNWSFVQEILDRVEERLESNSLKSGYAFMFDEDHNTIIAHRIRRNRSIFIDGKPDVEVQNNYGTRLIEDHHLDGLQRAVAEGRSSFAYEYPKGIAKISGLAPVKRDVETPDWVCGVGINNADIFAPVETLKNTLIAAALVAATLVILLTFTVARRISVPVKDLTIGARRIASGDFGERVSAKRRDEIGDLADTFNEMAASLEERSRALIELNRSLEEKVAERTRALEQSHREVNKAYNELKETQVQLVQSEKMASLGQLVAGIAHEIKNPLNFIYGNTDFLKKYVDELKQLIGVLETRMPSDGESRTEIDRFKRTINYDFVIEDLDTLIRNFEEGAKRIHDIIGDLRTFSRIDSDQLRAVDIHEPINLALNLMRNEYRDRVRIHKEFSDLPPVQCDPGKISQVIMNLLVNACHAIPGEGDIWIRTFPANGDLVIEIEDSGQGIPSENLGKVFEPFFTTKPVGKGTGLGLSISYGIIKQHRGTISVESARGKRTRFTVHLPLTI